MEQNQKNRINFLYQKGFAPFETGRPKAAVATPKARRFQTGFTLIEILVVISSIALLASIILVALNESRMMARDAKRKEDSVIIRTALQWYFHEYGAYPHNGAAGNRNQEINIQNLWSFLVPKFVNQIPNDPKNKPENYMYVWRNGGLDYGLYIPFSNEPGGQACKFITPNGSNNWFKDGPIITPNCGF